MTTPKKPLKEKVDRVREGQKNEGHITPSSNVGKEKMTKVEIQSKQGKKTKRREKPINPVGSDNGCGNTVG